MTVQEELVTTPTVDFGLATHFLKIAQAALEAGNLQEFEAARIMVGVALGLDVRGNENRSDLRPR